MRSFLHLFESKVPYKKKSQLYKICEALEMARGQWVSTLELHYACGSLAVSTKVSQVREKGVPIQHKEIVENTRPIHLYRIPIESLRKKYSVAEILLDNDL